MSEKVPPKDDTDKPKTYPQKEKFDPSPMAISCFFGVNCHQVLVSPKDIQWIEEQKKKSARNKLARDKKRATKVAKKNLFLKAIETLNTQRTKEFQNTFTTIGTPYEFRDSTSIITDSMKKKQFTNEQLESIIKSADARAALYKLIHEEFINQNSKSKRFIKALKNPK